MAASSGCADAPHAASQTRLSKTASAPGPPAQRERRFSAMRAFEAFVPGWLAHSPLALTNFDGSQHLRVERAMVLDIARLAERHDELARSLRARIETVVVRRHRVRRARAVREVPFNT